MEESWQEAIRQQGWLTRCTSSTWWRGRAPRRRRAAAAGARRGRRRARPSSAASRYCARFRRDLDVPARRARAVAATARGTWYGDTLVVQRGIPHPDGRRRCSGRHGLAPAPAGAAATAGGEARQRRATGHTTESQNKLAAVMTALEAEAFKLGYRFAALCGAATASSAMSASARRAEHLRLRGAAVHGGGGHDVIATADAAHIPVEMPAAEHPGLDRPPAHRLSAGAVIPRPSP